MALTQEQIQKARELAQSRGGISQQQATGSVSLLEKYGIGKPAEQPTTFASKVKEKLGGIQSEYEKAKTVAEIRQESGQQNPLSTAFQTGTAAAKAGVSSLLSPVTVATEEITSGIGSLINKGREVQKERDTEAIAEGKLAPEEALSNKPKIEEQFAEAIKPVIETSKETYEQSMEGASPEFKANIESLGSLAGTAFDVGSAVVGGKVAKDIGGSLVSKGMDTANAIKQSGGVGKALSDYAQDKMQSGARKELEDFMRSKKTLINQVNLASKKNIDLVDELADPSIYKNLKPVDGSINAQPAIDVVEDRIEKALEIKRATLPELDRFIPSVSKEELRTKAIADIAGTLTDADEKDLIARINRQIDAMPDELQISKVDEYRAKFRKSARDAKGTQKSDSEYTALENAFRDKVFEVTDPLSFESGKFKELNDFIRKNIALKEFLVKSMDGQKVSGGKLGVLGGRLIGAVAGSSGGILGTLAGAEGGTLISKILIDKQLGNSLKMRMIREVTDDPEIIRQAEALLKGVKDYEVPQLPARSSTEVPGTIKVAPEGLPGQFESTGLTPMVTPQVKNPSLPNNSGKNTTNNIMPNVSNIEDSLSQSVNKGKMSGFAQFTKDTSIPKELQPLAEEARKYKSAEEFANSFGLGKGGVGSGVEYTPNKRIMVEPHQVSLADILGKDGQVEIYRGVDRATQKNIVGGDYIATSKDLANTYTGEGKVLNKKVNLKDIFVDKTDGLTPEEIQKWLDGKDFHVEANYIPNPVSKQELIDLWNKANNRKGGFAEIARDADPAKLKIHPEDADVLNDFAKVLSSESKTTPETLKEMRKEVADLIEQYKIPVGKSDKQLAENIQKALYNVYHKFPGFADLGFLPKLAIGTAVATGGLKAGIEYKKSTKNK